MNNITLILNKQSIMFSLNLKPHLNNELFGDGVLLDGDLLKGVLHTVYHNSIPFFLGVLRVVASGKGMKRALRKFMSAKSEFEIKDQRERVFVIRRRM